MSDLQSDLEFIRENVSIVMWQVRNKGKLPESLDALQAKWQRDREEIVREWLQIQAELERKGIVVSKVAEGATKTSMLIK